MKITKKTIADLQCRPLDSLKKRAEFLALRKSPRFSVGEFVLQGYGGFVENQSESGNSNRIGYTVTKKIGNSVERSRIKRRLRHAAAIAVKALETGGDEPKSLQNSEFVLVARRGALSSPFTDLVIKLTKGIDQLATKGNKAR